MAKSKSSTSRAPVRVVSKSPRPSTPLASSPAAAEREKAGLRRGRERLDSRQTEGDTSIRSSLI